MTRIVLQSRGPFALVELLAKANHLELIMTEEPVAWTPPLTGWPASAGFAEEARALFFGPTSARRSCTYTRRRRRWLPKIRNRRRPRRRLHRRNVGSTPGIVARNLLA